MKNKIFFIIGFLLIGITFGLTIGTIINKKSINTEFNISAIKTILPAAEIITSKKENFLGNIKNMSVDTEINSALYIQPVVFSTANKISEALIKSKSLAMHEAKYYEQLENNSVICRLCPRECIIEDGCVGNCGVRSNVNGKLYSLVYSRPVTIAVDPIEKKPFYHFYPGQTTFSLATVGCNLHCLNCQNWQISQLSPFEMQEVRIMEPAEIIETAKKYNSKIISLTYSEPIIFLEYAIDIAKTARKNGMKTVVVSAGYINQEPLEELCKNVDAIKIDLKGITEKFYLNYTTGKLKPVLETLQTIKKSGVWLEIVNLIIPGANDSDEDLKKLCDWIKKNLGDETPLHFSKFFPLHKLKNKPQTPEASMRNAYNIAKNAGLKYVYIGNMASDYSNTFCSKCGKKIISRNGYNLTQNSINLGKCMFCGNIIPGKF